jgi:hypothetical protein
VGAVDDVVVPVVLVVDSVELLCDDARPHPPAVIQQSTAIAQRREARQVHPHETILKFSMV